MENMKLTNQEEHSCVWMVDTVLSYGTTCYIKMATVENWLLNHLHYFDPGEGLKAEGVKMHSKIQKNKQNGFFWGLSGRQVLVSKLAILSIALIAPGCKRWRPAERRIQVSWYFCLTPGKIPQQNHQLIFCIIRAKKSNFSGTNDAIYIP